jgi:hypothetical protein
VPLTFDGEAWAPFAQLAGLALPVRSKPPGQKKERVVSTKTCCSPTAA